MASRGERTAVVTGGNTGIGFETAKSLCAQGYRTLIACRNVEKAAAAKRRIKDAVPGAKVEAAYVDLADLKTVRDFASRTLDSGAPLDVLVNNAGGVKFHPALPGAVVDDLSGKPHPSGVQNPGELPLWPGFPSLTTVFHGNPLSNQAAQ